MSDEKLELFLDAEKQFRETLVAFIQSHKDLIIFKEDKSLLSALSRIETASEYLIMKMEISLTLHQAAEALIGFSHLFIVFMDYIDKYDAMVRGIEIMKQRRTEFLALKETGDGMKFLYQEKTYNDILRLMLVPLQRIPDYVVWCTELFFASDEHEELKIADDLFKDAMDVNNRAEISEHMLLLHKIDRKINDDLPLMNPKRRVLCRGTLTKKWGKKSGQGKKYKYFCFNDVMIYCEPQKLSSQLRYVNLFGLETVVATSEGKMVSFQYPTTKTQSRMLYNFEVKSELDAQTLVTAIHNLEPKDFQVEDKNSKGDFLRPAKFHGHLSKKTWVSSGLKLRKFYIEIKGKTIFIYKKETSTTPADMVKLRKIDIVTIDQKEQLITFMKGTKARAGFKIPEDEEVAIDFLEEVMAFVELDSSVTDLYPALLEYVAEQ